MFSCDLAFALHYVECVNVPDPSASASSFGVPSVVDGENNGLSVAI